MITESMLKQKSAARALPQLQSLVMDSNVSFWSEEQAGIKPGAGDQSPFSLITWERNSSKHAFPVCVLRHELCKTELCQKFTPSSALRDKGS